MNIDQTNIKKGPLRKILPHFFPNSISYLSELNEYRIYAEMWHNKRNEEAKKRMDITDPNFKQTLHFGVQAYKKTVQQKTEFRQRKPDDIIRFEHFVLAESVNYHINIYGDLMLQLSGIERNSILEDEFSVCNDLKKGMNLQAGSTFHSDENTPGKIDVALKNLDLQKCEKSGNCYFEINTGSKDISNTYQDKILKIILGEHEFTEKLGLLYRADRKQIRCIFENPGYVREKALGGNVIPRLCIAEPFYETLIFNFAGTLDDCEEVCLLGIPIEEENG